MKVKMKWSDRVLLALYGCLGIVLTVLIAVGMCTGLEITLLGYRISLGEGVGPMVALAVVAAVLLVWSVQMIRLALRREPSPEKGSVSVQNTENGAVRISVQAMDTLVKQAIGQADGVEEIKTSIVNHEDSISVNIDMTLRSDVHIPNVTMLMQRSIKNFIEEFSGIAVRDVSVLVSRIVESEPPQLTTIQAEPPKAVEAPKEEEQPQEQDGYEAQSAAAFQAQEGEQAAASQEGEQAAASQEEEQDAASQEEEQAAADGYEAQSAAFQGEDEAQSAAAPQEDDGAQEDWAQPVGEAGPEPVYETEPVWEGEDAGQDGTAEESQAQEEPEIQGELDQPDEEDGAADKAAPHHADIG